MRQVFHGVQTDSSKFGVARKLKPGESFSNWAFTVKSASLSVHRFALITKTITSINLKFGGKVVYGVQMDSSKFGVICLKIKARREFYLFLIGNTQ